MGTMQRSHSSRAEFLLALPPATDGGKTGSGHETPPGLGDPVEASAMRIGLGHVSLPLLKASRCRPGMRQRWPGGGHVHLFPRHRHLARPDQAVAIAGDQYGFVALRFKRLCPARRMTPNERLPRVRSLQNGLRYHPLQVVR